MKKNLLWLSLAIICLIQAASAQTNNLIPAAKAYTIGPGDEITVKVLGEKDFDAVATVDENGNIELPFLDAAVPAMCKNERELRADIGKILGKYLRAPQVALNIKRNSRPPVAVSGEVKNQQQVILTRKTRLWELITFSGGITDDAGGMIEVFRTQPPICAEPEELAAWKTEASANRDLGGYAQMYRISTVQQGKDDSNPVIYPGDIINVQKGRPVYITGELKGGQSGLMIKEGGLQLMQAIAMVGGVSQGAKTKDIKIYRLKPDSTERETISVNLDSIKKQGTGDVPLQPYDIVEVGKAREGIGSIILKAATGSVGGGISAIATGGATKVLY